MTDKHQIITNAREWLNKYGDCTLHTTVIKDLLSLVDSQEQPILTNKEVSCSSVAVKGDERLKMLTDDPADKVFYESVKLQPLTNKEGEI